MSSIDLVSYVHQPFIRPHYPQCNCNKSRPGGKSLLISPTDPASCYKANKWLRNNKLPINPNGVYIQLLSISYEVPVDPQLTLDISRTFNSSEYFKLGMGKEVLQRILHTFTAYCPNLGYVQGMNYIVGTLLWHCNEVDTFWLFIGLLEDYELRDNFRSNFPGLKKHFHVLDFLINFHYPEIFSHFLNLNLNVQMFATDWLLTLFCHSTPVEVSKYVLGKFFKYGWNFIYKLCIEIIGRLKAKILAAKRFSDIMGLLKPEDSNPKAWKGFVKSLERSKENVNWKKVVKKANNFVIDDWFINCMKHNSVNMAESP